MSRDPVLRLEDILQAGVLIEEYILGFDQDTFAADRRTVDAVTRNLEILGEAIKHLPDEMKDRFPHIPWKAIAGFRDILAHCYFRADDSIIWDAAKHHVPAVRDAARQLLEG